MARVGDMDAVLARLWQRWTSWSPRWVFPFRLVGRLCYLVSVGHWPLQQL